MTDDPKQAQTNVNPANQISEPKPVDITAVNKPATGQKKEGIVKKIPKDGMKKNVLTTLTALVVVLAGVGTGWLASGMPSGSSEQVSNTVTETSDEGEVLEMGSYEDGDEESPEGLLVEGGIEGEGTHHLDRDLGPTKYVYLTSTSLDIQAFVGKKVKVWGETVAGKQAGWLMDVQKIKVIE